MKASRLDDAEVQHVHAALERWTRRDRKYRELSRAVREAQAELRRLVGDDGWDRYLALEERMNARHVELILAAVKIALNNRRKTKRMK